MKRILALVLMTALLLCGLTSCMGGSDIAKVKEANKLVVGVTVYEPMDYIDDVTGEWVGFDAELAQMFAESLGVNCQIVIIKWKNKVAEINAGQIDLIWNGMTASDELGEEIDFSIPYAKNAQVVVVKSDSNYTAADVAGLSLAVEDASAGDKTATNVIKASTINKVGSQVDALNEVASGNSQAAVIDLTMAESMLGKGDYTGLKLVDGARYGEEIFAVGLRKGSDLKAELDAFLKAKYTDGTMAGLLEKYAVSLNEDALK
ncbi:MAG: transporter substrate-binding domain-containing protein [Clostridia bacterium]|nr:transporter substrate-binding domain-containing protein [Clostridia bacterium]